MKKNILPILLVTVCATSSAWAKLACVADVVTKSGQTTTHHTAPLESITSDPHNFNYNRSFVLNLDGFKFIANFIDAQNQDLPPNSPEYNFIVVSTQIWVKDDEGPESGNHATSDPGLNALRKNEETGISLRSAYKGVSSVATLNCKFE